MAATTLNFGKVNAGATKSLSTTATNSGTASVTITSVSISAKHFSLLEPSLPVTITGGQSVPVKVSFTPNTAGSFSATLSVASDASDSVATVALSGTGATTGQLAPSAASENFGSLTVGSSTTLSETLTNTETSSITISQLGLSGSNFSLGGISAPMTLAAGQSVTLDVTFAPTAAGTSNGNLTVTSDATNPTLTIPLSGSGTTATAQLAVSPGNLNFGSVVVGSSGTASGSLTASGASVTITNAATNNSAFAVVGLTLPFTISAGQSHTFTISFSPLTTGSASATLTFTSNAQPSSTSEPVTGSGTAAPTHSVSLNWTASTSADIAGYNIYRAVYSTSCGSFKKLNSSLNPTTLYTDSTVTNGASYCYAATTVNSAKEESSYSNTVSNIQIPSQ